MGTKGKPRARRAKWQSRPPKAGLDSKSKKRIRDMKARLRAVEYVTDRLQMRLQVLIDELISRDQVSASGRDKEDPFTRLMQEEE